ncbi:hypothetical protein [Kushneria aurantia]|uniref:AI-2E family transporter n=1 Tax=Kushneria aurantia TaxID=504092 RepID=A0ABV6G3L2_9GAMM|nr:hypothetical protein [Kushneria aurantia]
MSQSIEGRGRRTPAKLVWLLLVLAWGAFMVPRVGTGVLLGWPLNLAAFCLAIVVIARGGRLVGGIQLALSVVVSPLVYLLGLLLLGLIGAFNTEVEVEFHALPPPREQQPAPPPATGLQRTSLVVIRAQPQASL